MIAFELAADHVVVPKMHLERDDYLQGVTDNRTHQHVILAMISSTTRDRWASDVPIEAWQRATARRW